MKEPKLYGPDGHLIRFDMRNTPEERRALQWLTKNARAQFKASESNRFNANWSASNEAINTTLTRELKTLRARSRWLEHNNPYMIGAINQLVNYCVGTGFELQMNVRKTELVDGEYVVTDMDNFNDYVESLFSDWSEDVSINAPGTSPDSFAEIQRVCARRLIVDGEILVHTVYDKSNGTTPLYLELIDADNLDTNQTEYNGNPIVLGVEVDKNTWRPVAYWVFSTVDQHPSRPSKINSVRVSAEDMIHVYKKHFPNQLRGIPFAAGVTQRFYDIDSYNESQMIRNKIAAAFGVLLKNASDQGNILTDSNASDSLDDETGFPVDAEGNILATVAPGMIGRLPEGVEPFQINPTSPENTYQMFLGEQLKAIGAGTEIGLSYTSLTRDTTKTTFAGGRQAENMDMQGYRPFMQFLSQKECTPVFNRWFDLAVLSGALTAPGYEFNPRFWRRHKWMPGGWSRGINPLQEENAREKSMKNYITTLADEAAWNGKDWKTQLRIAAKIQRERERLGLPDPTEKGPAGAARDMKELTEQTTEAVIRRLRGEHATEDQTQILQPAD
jgi:lambda family phage portal protein